MLSLRVSLLGVLLFSSLNYAAPVDFDRDVAPLLASRCFDCHGGEDGKGGIDLSKKAGVDPNALWKQVSSDKMPPKKPLSEKEKSILKEWIASGAKWGTDPIDPYGTTTSTRAGRDWWSLQPLQKVSPPKFDKYTNPIDQFILTKLRENKFTPAPQADKRTLIRRVYFDLVGYPPTFEEIEAFVKDTAPNAYEKLVDRLLDSRHYGERWGRLWLDVARYAETSGYERDQTKTGVWKYRDWVIKAFNDDMPYNRFVMEQLAGDELPDATPSSLIATGFIRLGTWNDEPNDPNEYKYDRLEDMVGATSTAFLGLTVKCARCHDHKFDAIRQTDYYRMAGAFWAGYIEAGPREHLGGPDPKKFEGGVFAWTDRGREVPPIKLLKKGDPTRPAGVVEAGPLSTIAFLDKPFAQPTKESKTTTRRLQLAQWITNPKNPLTARVWVNRIWQGHFGTGLVRTPDNFGFTGEKPTHPELLDWLAQDLMTHDWKTKRLHKMLLLSATYQQNSIHPQQEEYAKLDASNRLWWRGERRRIDAESLRDSLLFASGKLQLDRYGGESFLPEIPLDALEGLSTKSAAWKPSPVSEQGRRSVYIFAKRGLLPPLLTTFDLPDTTLPNCKRDSTTVPTQALALLNNPFAHEQSLALAQRIGTKGSLEERAKMAWRFALGRDPKPEEVKLALEHLRKQELLFAKDKDKELKALASLCHVLLNTNEFIYVD